MSWILHRDSRGIVNGLNSDYFVSVEYDKKNNCIKFRDKEGLEHMFWADLYPNLWQAVLEDSKGVVGA
jgi:hypothetical protein